MAGRRNHRISVNIPEIDELGTIPVHNLVNFEGIHKVFDTQATFGGDVRARLVVDTVNGRKTVTVVLRYTSFKVRVGELDPAIVRLVRRRIRWLNLLNRVVVCEAQIVADPKNPALYTVLLNPTHSEARLQERAAPLGRPPIVR
ncbi:hypothetical protein [Subtercola sp. RTI3]|uniref:hypothetical protein n=1 Tax=Subtercola sp. RTI3 TaxID=3048639 RepID=UPI002B22E24B|nr:hypothetical protein [Subtercola sp. RTI3]MEA9985949.1 hypothetical protein [Subtercola sp. RTI3]